MYFHLIILAHAGLAIKPPLRIYGGIDAKPDEFPYVVRIEVRYLLNIKNSKDEAVHGHSCTASALSPEWLLSAAHCLTIIKQGLPGLDEPKEGMDLTIKMVIRFGHVENSPWEKNTFSDVLLIVIHPLYSNNEMTNEKTQLRNDIGLLKVTPINMKSYIKLSAVDYQTMYGHQVTVAGFGITTKTDNEGKIETNVTLILKKPLQVLKVIVTKCYFWNLVPSLCLAPTCNDDINICQGDSGGPVIHPSGLIGVLSLTDHTRYCGDPITRKRLDVAGIITPISPYIVWISSYVTGAKLINASN